MTKLSENISLSSVTILPKLDDDHDGDWGTKSESQV